MHVARCVVQGALYQDRYKSDPAFAIQIYGNAEQDRVRCSMPHATIKATQDPDSIANHIDVSITVEFVAWEAIPQNAHTPTATITGSLYR